ncbi:MAG: glycosyltransferase family 2 protein, partial [Pseudomonadota bacterium]|nr:glycosyltransferase family 2 protein [Pseudomonadota bacterium]
MHQFDVSVVLPAKNEAKNLSALLREIAEVVPSTTTEIIVVDDGSSDDSLSLLHNLSSTLPVSCRVIVHPMSCGQSTSVFHGVLQAKGKWIITLDADGQNDPADIPRLIRAAKETNAAHFCVIGHRKKRKDTPWKR